VDEDAALAAGVDHLGHRLGRADLVVGPLHVHQRGVGADGVEDGAGVDAAGTVDRHEGDVAVALRREPHGRVLDRGDDLVAAPFRSPPARGGDGLGGAAGEDDLAGSSPEELGDLGAGLLEGVARREPLGVDAAGIGARRPQPRRHRVDHLRPRRRRRRVVEVVATHFSTVVTHTSSPRATLAAVSGLVSP
jgi:hypothetical protein